MKTTLSVIAMLILGVACSSSACATPVSRSEWSILVYMNGHNNLENEIPVNFKQMSTVGSSEKVNIVAQVAKLGNGPGGEAWRDKTYRYHVTQGMKLSPENAVMVLGQSDMGSPDTLKKFIEWGATNYPAKHYMLIMWGHGQGYRLQLLASGMQHRLNNMLRMSIDATSTYSFPSNISSMSPYRTVSSDDLFNSKLYMSDLQNVLQDIEGEARNFFGGKLNVLVFDACLMSMLENAYAFRNVAQVMVASQDLVPGRGMRYDPWLAALTKEPTMNPENIGALIVNTFANEYQSNDASTTMSETDLTKANTLALDTSMLADKLIATLPNSTNEITTARSVCPYYAPDPFNDGQDYFFHIDLGCFVEGLSKSTDQGIQMAAAQVRQDLRSAILNSYAGSERKSFGSNGLCIYFPKSRNEFNGDLYAEGGYIKSNLVHPVEFVQKLRWSDFLSAYYDALEANRISASASTALKPPR